MGILTRSIPVHNESAATYRFGPPDVGRLVRFTGAAAVHAVIPVETSSNPDFTLGDVIRVYAAGAGGVSLVAEAGVTIRNGSAALVQYEEVQLRRDDLNVWTVTDRGTNVSGFAQGLLGAADAAAARTLLDAQQSGSYVRTGAPLVVDAATSGGVSGEFATLAAAVAASSDGDVIFLRSDLSLNTLTTINKKVTIDAPGRVITCGTAGGIAVARDDVEILGLKIVATGTVSFVNGQIFAQGVDGFRARGLRFEGGTHQLNLNDCSDFTVEDTQHAVTTVPGTSCVFLFQSSNGTVDGVKILPGVIPTYVGAPRLFLANQCSSLALSNINIRGVDMSPCTTGGGFSMMACTNCTVSDSVILALKAADGVVVEEGSTDIVFSNVVSSGHNASAGVGAGGTETGDGFDIFNSSRIWLVNCLARGNGFIGGHPNVEIYTSNEVYLLNCDTSEGTGTGAGASGVIVRGSPNVTLFNVTSKGNQSGGLSAFNVSGAECTNLKIIGGDYTDNNAAASTTTGQAEGIYLAAGTTATLIGVRGTDTRTPKLQKYGLRMENTAKASITACGFEGNLTGTIQDSVGKSTISGALFPSTAGTDVWTVKVDGDTSPRFVLNADGSMEWGDGTAATDVLLYRVSATVLKLNTYFQTLGDITVRPGSASEVRLGDIGVGNQSAVTFGAASGLVKLYRSADDVLKTDDSFHVALDLRHLGTNLGFYNHATATQQTVTGSRGGNAALASLLTALAATGLLVDSSS